MSLELDRYKAGTDSYLNVITTQTIALSDQQTAVTILQRRMVAAVDLVKALGGGWDASTLPSRRRSSIRLAGRSEEHTRSRAPKINRPLPLRFPASERACGIHHLAADHREQRLDSTDLIDRRRHVILR